MSLNTKEKLKLPYGKIALISIIVLIIIAAIIVMTVGRNNSIPEEPQPDNDISGEVSKESADDTAITIDFAGMEVLIDETIRTNTFKPEDFTENEDGSLTYNGENAVYGIDVSAFQGEIDWEAVKESGIDFAIIRLGFRGMSEGELYTDDNYYTNIEGAENAGLETGVYFFSQATSVVEAAQEARYVLEILDGRVLDLPIIFDWEPGYDNQYRTSSIHSDPVINDFARAFCNIITDAGYKSGIYFNCTQGYLQYDLSMFDDVCLWLAEYDTKPEFYYYFDMWQYSCTGTVDGIETPVDLNIMFK